MEGGIRYVRGHQEERRDQGMKSSIKTLFENERYSISWYNSLFDDYKTFFITPMITVSRIQGGNIRFDIAVLFFAISIWRKYETVSTK